MGWMSWLAMTLAVSDLVANGQTGYSMGVCLAITQWMVGMAILTLGMPLTLRRGLAKCTSRTRMKGMTIGAMLFTGAVTAGVLAFRAKMPELFNRYLSLNGLVYGANDPFTYVCHLGNQFDLRYDYVFGCILISGLILEIRCMEEFFAADGDEVSAVMLDVLTAVAIYALSKLEALITFPPEFIFAGILLLGVVVALITGKKHVRTGERLRVSLVPVLRESPVALMQVGLYPLAAAVIVAVDMLFGTFTQGAETDLLVLCGFLLVEMGRTPFRRSRGEATGFVLLVTGLSLLATGALVGLYTQSGVAAEYAFVRGRFIYAAAGALMLLYAPLNVRMMLSGALLMLAGLFPTYEYFSMDLAPLAILAAVMVAALLAVPEWGEFIRIRRVKRIRARAMRSRK